jgi:hypothetical protein
MLPSMIVSLANKKVVSARTILKIIMNLAGTIYRVFG